MAELPRNMAVYLQGRASEMAAAHATSREYLRFQIASDPVMLGALIWDDGGREIHPPSDAAWTTQEDAQLNDFELMRGLRNTEGIALAHPVEQNRVYYCSTRHQTCLALQTSALADAMGQSVQETHMAFTTRRSSFWLWLLPIASLFAVILLWRRLRGDVPEARQFEEFEDPEQFSVGDLCISPRRLRATRDDLEITLSRRDLSLLQHFFAHRGEVVSRDALYDAGWGRDFMPNSRALDQHIITLRRKLDPDRSRPQLIETVRAAGYRMVDQ